MMLHRDFDAQLPPYAQTDEIFADIIRQFDTPAANKMLEIARLRKVLLPTIRAEFEMAYKYQHRPVEPFAFRSAVLSAMRIHGYRKKIQPAGATFTRGGFINHVCQGSHFLMAEDGDYILDAINKEFVESDGQRESRALTIALTGERVCPGVNAKSIFQLLLGLDEICGVKALAKRPEDLAECSARVGGIVLQLGQVIETEAKFKFKQFGLLLSRTLRPFKNNALPDPDFDLIADIFRRASDIFRPHKSVRCYPRQASIAPAAKIRAPARNVCFLCMRLRAIPEEYKSNSNAPVARSFSKPSWISATPFSNSPC